MYAVRTRIAPSPTGDIHLGTARTAYFNYLAAKSTPNGKFFLRIDDTDEERNREECVQVITETMQWLGLNHDQCFRQSERKSIYQDYARLLLNAGLAKELHNGAIALRWFDRYGDKWEDCIAGSISISPTNKAQIDERLILLKGHPTGMATLSGDIKDEYGNPTYQFASVVDDWSYHITHIIRGTDHISNTPKQVAIWHALNEIVRKIGGEVVELPKFAHIGLIFHDKKKMSKRDNAASMLHYKKQGFLPQAMLNCMLRLGWGGGSIPDKPICKREALDFFWKGTMKNININFDPKKLEFLNTFYSKKSYLSK